jgi:catechol 2,3-dioxygenase-like lactoylglutathione lyase family enzyme
MPQEIVFGRIAPTLPVADMARALAFYQRELGMTPVFTNGDPMMFAILTRDDAELHLHIAPAAARPAPPPGEVTNLNQAHLLVSDARALHDRLAAAGVPIVKALRDAPYGLRDFVFADPDGNRIDVGERL